MPDETPDTLPCPWCNGAGTVPDRPPQPTVPQVPLSEAMRRAARATLSPGDSITFTEHFTVGQPTCRHVFAINSQACLHCGHVPDFSDGVFDEPVSPTTPPHPSYVALMQRYCNIPGMHGSSAQRAVTVRELMEGDGPAKAMADASVATPRVEVDLPDADLPDLDAIELIEDPIERSDARTEAISELMRLIEDQDVDEGTRNQARGRLLGWHRPGRRP